MSEKDFDVRAEIMAAISKTDDPKDRSILLLMLGVLEKVENWFEDETALQNKVLNGLTIRHKTDHEWIAMQRDSNCHEICEWVKGFREEHDAAKEDKRKIKTGVMQAVIVKAAEYAAIGLAAGIGLKVFG